MGNLASAYREDRKLNLAIPMLEEARRSLIATLGKDHPNTLTYANNLAGAYRDARDFDRSIPLYEETVKLLKERRGPEHPLTQGCMGNLGRAYVEARNYTAAARTYEELVAIERRTLPPEHATLIRNLGLLGDSLLRIKQAAKAEPVLRECLALREKTEPDAVTTWLTKSQLGAALLEQKNYAAAEPLLLAGFEGLNQRKAQLTAASQGRITEVLNRIVKLYDAWGKPDQAAVWRKRLESHMKEPGSS
jgi:tetratricopeptide (TPR) repeat protein